MIMRKFDEYDEELLSVVALFGSMISTLLPDPMTKPQLELAIQIREHLGKLLTISTIMVNNEKQGRNNGKGNEAIDRL